MDRADLLSTLKRVAGAISNKTFLPILTHLCFDGSCVIAYDDVVALRAPCTLDFEGCIVGDRLLAILSSSRASSVECIAEKSEVVLKLGRTKARFAFLPQSEFPFTPPSKKGIKLVVDEKLQRAFKIASCSAGRDSAFPSRLGITCVFGRKKLTLYAADNLTIVRVVLNHSESKLEGQQFILLPRFYDLLLAMKGANLVITPKNNILGMSKELELFGKVLPDANPEQFEKAFEAAKLKEIPKADVPSAFARCLERAIVVDKDLTEFSYADGRLIMITKGQGCEVRDSVKIDLGEDSIEVFSSSECLSRYLGFVSRIGIATQCLHLQGDGFDALIGVKAKE